jgi:DNA-binding CsgD family transcriptional regulator
LMRLPQHSFVGAGWIWTIVQVGTCGEMSLPWQLGHRGQGRVNLLPQRSDETGLVLRAAAPMVGASPELEIVLWNDAAQALLGFTASEVIGRHCFEVLRCPRATRRLYCAGPGERVGSCGTECVPAFETELSSRSGERMSVGVTTVVVGSGDGATLRLHLLRELRRERQLEELLRHVVSTASKVSASAGGAVPDAPRPPTVRGVSPRERQVVRLLAQGSSTADIAAQLGITRRTARNHIQNILTKLRVHSRLEAVAYASARGLL